MRVQIEPEVLSYMSDHQYGTIRVTADRECAGAICSDAFIYPVIDYTAPSLEVFDRYDAIETEGITVYFDKTLEVVPEVTIFKERHLFRDLIKVRGLPTLQTVTHFKL